MKLNSKIYRKAAEIAAANQFDAYCCNAIYEAVHDANECNHNYITRFERLFHPKRKEVTTETWEDLDIFGYWGKSNRETTKYRVLALLLLAEMVETKN